MAAKYFINEGEFKTTADKQHQEASVLNWAKVDIGVTYQITKIEERFSAKWNNKVFIIHAVDKFDKKIKVWGPGVMVGRIKEYREPSDLVFFKCLGQEIKENGKADNKFDLVIESHNIKPFELFEKKE